ncbi:MAG: Hsp20 family protein [Candidatus Auribacterota bacterium]|nr:Hsp20 family protein [Candidatus Auribacterota bacterium]
MTQQFRKWAIIIVASVLVITVWSILAWKVFRLFFDEDYIKASPTGRVPFSVQDLDIPPATQAIDSVIDTDKVAQHTAESVRKIQYLTDQINQRIKDSHGDIDSFAELYLMDIEDDTEKNRYIVTVKWPEMLSVDLSIEVDESELKLTSTQSASSSTEWDNVVIDKNSKSISFKGVIDLPGPGLNEGTTFVMENGILMVFIPKKR